MIIRLISGAELAPGHVGYFTKALERSMARRGNLDPGTISVDTLIEGR